MNSFQPAKALLVAAVIGIGLSGGLAAAAFLPGGSMPGAVAQVWDQTVERITQHGFGEKSSLFAAAASYIGITEAQLRTELGSDKSLADVAVAHGKTRDGLIAALVAVQQQSITALVDQKGIGTRGALPPGPRVDDRNVTGDSYAAAARYLATTTADLQTKLRAGQTLAQIANSTAGKSRDGLVAYLLNDAKTKIAAAQAAGTITADQATRLNDRLTESITRLVDRTGFGPGGRRGR